MCSDLGLSFLNAIPPLPTMITCPVLAIERMTSMIVFRIALGRQDSIHWEPDSWD